jgi:transposase DDE domain
MDSCFTESFKDLEDHRRTNKGNFRHSLQEIILLTISAVLCGFETYELIEYFGKKELDWLRKFFPYKYGVPSNDTLGEFFKNINRKNFSKCLVSFLQNLKKFDSELISLDGKTIKGSSDEDGHPLHILTAFCQKNKMSLGEELVYKKKENEIVAIPKLLSILEIKGCVISIDAMGCQKDIVERIVEEKADYVIQVKDNQRELHQNLKDTFKLEKIEAVFSTEEIGHGRIETRKYSIISDLSHVSDREKWQTVKSLIRVDTIVCEKKTGKETKSERYYISSLKEDIEKIAEYIRGHWEIESMHWSLDVIFKEDNQAKRDNNAIANFNTICKFAMSLLNDEQTYKGSKTKKRAEALYEPEYREKLLKL